MMETIVFQLPTFFSESSFYPVYIIYPGLDDISNSRTLFSLLLLFPISLVLSFIYFPWNRLYHNKYDGGSALV